MGGALQTRSLFSGHFSDFLLKIWNIRNIYLIFGTNYYDSTIAELSTVTRPCF